MCKSGLEVLAMSCVAFRKGLNGTLDHISLALEFQAHRLG